MPFENIPYQSFCWVIGTTSFRTAQLNLKIEQQLIMLSELHDAKQSWNWSNSLQVEYYDYMEEKEFVQGDAKRKDKDAREKTSGLVDIGLINSNRELTEVGVILKDMSKQHGFKANNFFDLEADSYLYFKQLLKVDLSINQHTIRPYIILLKLLNEFNYLSNDEFCYFLPLCISDETTKNIIQKIHLFRENKVKINDVIYSHLMQFDNYQQAFNLFKENTVNETLICTIGMNRKSRNYDKPYYDLYQSLKRVIVDKNHDEKSILDLYKKAKTTKQGSSWIGFIFKKVNAKNIKKELGKNINNQLLSLNENDFKEIFFKYLHVFKAKATLQDYFDLNRRYFNLTDTIIFDDNQVKFDILPKYFFKNNIDALYKIAYQKCNNLTKNIDLELIHSSLIVDEKSIIKQISEDYKGKVNTGEQVKNWLNKEKQERFIKLINDKFHIGNLLKLLDYFESRNDKKIQEITTDSADIPTIFEYILAIIWYEISNRKGDIFQFMNLSLQANLLPKSHAVGGYADIIYQYEEDKNYPKHDVLIEATLATDSNQRRMELEPVSRHLGEYLLKYKNTHDYAIFISTYLHRNVVADFRSRKYMPYYDKNGEYIDGMKIIPINTAWLKNALKQNKKYPDLYQLFETAHNQDIKPHEWEQAIILD